MIITTDDGHRGIMIAPANHLHGWVLCRGADNQWVSLREATPGEMRMAETLAEWMRSTSATPEKP